MTLLCNQRNIMCSPHSISIAVGHNYNAILCSKTKLYVIDGLFVLCLHGNARVPHQVNISTHLMSAKRPNSIMLVHGTSFSFRQFHEMSY
jgi:hypothetical protein